MLKNRKKRAELKLRGTYRASCLCFSLILSAIGSLLWIPSLPSNLLKKKIQLSKFEDVIDFLSNSWIGSIPSRKQRDTPRSCTKWRVFIEARCRQKFFSRRKERIVSCHVTFFWEKGKSLSYRLSLLSWAGVCGQGPLWQIYLIGVA